MKRLHSLINRSHKGRPYSMLRKGVGVFYSEKDGREVLRWETKWHKISGFWVNTNRGCWWIRFRRFGRAPWMPSRRHPMRKLLCRMGLHFMRERLLDDQWACQCRRVFLNLEDLRS